MNTPGNFWVVTCHFNAAEYQAPIHNYRVFADRLAQQGANLLTIELAFGDRPYSLPDGPHVHRLRGSSVLWQKERLLNYALTLLPSECDKVAWVDADILWPDETWVERACDALDRHFDVIQLFEGAFRLFNGQTDWTERNPHKQPLWWEPGTAFHLCNNWPFEGSAIGFAWAARKAWLQHVRLYERSILGGGDYILLNAIFDRDQPWGHGPLDEDVAIWKKRVRDTSPRVGYIAGTICHLFHGNMANRRYMDRHLILQKHNYRPTSDIVVIDNVWEWATHKPDLHGAVRDYFLGRKEDEEWVDETKSRDSF